VKKILNLIKSNEIPKSEGYPFLLDYCRENNFQFLYKSLYDDAPKSELGSFKYDADWVNTQEKTLHEQISKKEQELNTYKLNNLKQSIQQTYIEMAKLYYEAGALSNFDQAILKAKDYSSHLPNHEFLFYYKLSMILNGKLEDIRSILTTNEDLKSLTPENKVFYSNHRAITSIALLNEKKDLSGALTGLLVLNVENLRFAEEYSSLSNLAIYLAVLSVLCLKRNEINARILGTESKALLNQNIFAQRFIESFYSANYQETTSNLQLLIQHLDKDPFMRQNKEIFANMIMDKIIKQHLQPITRISISKMANSLNLEQKPLFETLKEMIKNKDIPFLIDPIAMTLELRKEKKKTREQIIKHALKLTTNYVLEKSLGILRYNLGMRRKNMQDSMAAEGQSTGKNIGK